MKDASRSDEPIFLDDAAEPIFEDDAPATANPASGTARPPAPKFNRFQWIVGIILLVALLSVCGYFIGTPLVRMGLPRLIAYPFGSILTILSILLLGALTDKDKRADIKELWRDSIEIVKFLPIVCAQLLREFENIDLRAARHAAKSRGRMIRHGQVLIWSDISNGAENEIANALDAASKEFADVTGLSADRIRPIRVICFNSGKAFNAYTHRGYDENMQSTAYYSGLRHKRIVVRSDSELWSGDLLKTVSSEFAHRLLRSHLTRLKYQWIGMGITSLIASRVGRNDCEPNAGARFLRSERRRGRIISGEQLIGMEYSDLYRRHKIWDTVRDAAFAFTFNAQSVSFCKWLLDADAHAFQQLLHSQNSASSKEEQSRLFQRLFHRTADEMMKDWEQHRLSQTLPDYQIPDQRLAEQIRQKLIRPIQDVNADEGNVRLLIRRFGFLGYPLRCDVLIGLLANSNENIRNEAEFALANIAGQSFGNDREAWANWYHSLPAPWHEIPGERPA